MALPKYENIVADGSYLIDSETGEKVVFYECDPQKNCECADKGMCAPCPPKRVAVWAAAPRLSTLPFVRMAVVAGMQF